MEPKISAISAWSRSSSPDNRNCWSISARIPCPGRPAWCGSSSTLQASPEQSLADDGAPPTPYIRPCLRPRSTRLGPPPLALLTPPILPCPPPLPLTELPAPSPALLRILQLPPPPPGHVPLSSAPLPLRLRSISSPLRSSSCNAAGASAGCEAWRGRVPLAVPAALETSSAPFVRALQEPGCERSSHPSVADGRCALAVLAGALLRRLDVLRGLVRRGEDPCLAFPADGDGGAWRACVPRPMRLAAGAASEPTRFWQA
mmetsp:Transcript_37046/g.85545  ORF Transcript_37046/g.85545 Transcript_37046/m.85545 type:complete len:259 (+) Transcript_37046:799-1575(+)